jgi:hypothetical protein
MSMQALFGRLASRLGRQKWGAKIEGRDTAVDPLAQELQAMFNSDGPLELSEPIRIIKKHRGPLFDVVYGSDDAAPLAQFTRNGQQVSQVQPTAQGETATTERVTQNIANAVGSLYRVAGIGENGLLTLDEIDASGTPTGTQIQARGLV